MCPLSDETPMIEKEDMIGVLDRRETMSDNDRGPSLHKNIES
jgi:hypothetical protein